MAGTIKVDVKLEVTREELEKLIPQTFAKIKDKWLVFNSIYPLGGELKFPFNSIHNIDRKPCFSFERLGITIPQYITKFVAHLCEQECDYSGFKLKIGYFLEQFHKS